MTRARIALVFCGLILWAWLAGAIVCLGRRTSVRAATPVTWFQYARFYQVKSVARLLLMSGVLSGMALGAAVAFLFAPETLSPYGDARWANFRDVKKAGLLDGKGIILGKRSGAQLCVDGWEHVMCFAPSGSGKGVGVVVPNLLHWPDSAIVHDVKGENFRLTSGFRAHHGQKVYFFNPGDPEGKTHRYNPFQFVSDNPGLRIDDLQKIAHLLLPKQDFWENEARTLLVGLALYLMGKSDSIVTFGNIVCLIRGSNFCDFVTDLLTNDRDSLNPAAAMALNAFIQKAEKERSAVLSTLNASLELWANPLIDAATSASDFDLRKFKKERTTLYVGVSPNNLHRLRPLLQIFYQQATDILTEKEPNLKTEPYGVLFLMDEFASLGRMTQFEQASAYFRGYRVRFMMIIQDLPQLERHYERAGLHSFLGMSKVKITFAADNYETASLISKYLGTYAADTRSESRSQRLGLSMDMGSRSRSESKTARALLLPQEILQLPRDQAIIMIESTPPVRATKIRYYEEAVFKNRIMPAIPMVAIKPITRRIDEMTPPKARGLTDAEKDAIAREFDLDLDQQQDVPNARPA